jgi:tripartite-type tricarboxylate transporter receptor subunit TctC
VNKRTLLAGLSCSLALPLLFSITAFAQARNTRVVVPLQAGSSLDAAPTDPGNALAQVKGGHLKALAVSSKQRNPVTPDWPAIAETLPGFDFPSWNALMGPANLPRDMVKRLSDAAAQALKQKDVIDRMATTGTVPLIMSSDELKAFVDSETAKWVRLAREANIQPE